MVQDCMLDCMKDKMLGRLTDLVRILVGRRACARAYATPLDGVIFFSAAARLRDAAVCPPPVLVCRDEDI